MDIHFDDAASAYHGSSERRSAAKEARYQEILEEVKTTDMSMCDARDIYFFADELGISPKEVREINRQHQNLDVLDMLNTFHEDETDDIFDYYS